MENEITLRQWQDNFNNGAYDMKDRATQIRAGWYDWFCNDYALRNKTYKMAKVLTRIIEGGKVDLDKIYIFFKNNCPCAFPLYDDFRICDLETGNVLLNCNFNNKRYDKRYVVFGIDNRGVEYWGKNDEDILFATNSIKELVNWFNEPWGK